MTSAMTLGWRSFDRGQCNSLQVRIIMTAYFHDQSSAPASTVSRGVLWRRRTCIMNSTKGFDGWYSDGSNPSRIPDGFGAAVGVGIAVDDVPAMALEVLGSLGIPL